jgi:hypothetical protein
VKERERLEELLGRIILKTIRKKKNIGCVDWFIYLRIRVYGGLL